MVGIGIQPAGQEAAAKAGATALLDQLLQPALLELLPLLPPHDPPLP